LVAAAKTRGDPDAARTVGAARRPTTAAWLVNLLVLTDTTVRPRLAELHQDLRAAHAEMDGPRIRELSKKQRVLMHELTAAALAATGQAHPTSALREEVSGTLQAAVADPDVTARLGRLTKAETWSGFADFGTSSAVTTRAAATKRTTATKQPAPQPAPGEPQDRPEIGRALRRRDAVAAAEEHRDKLAAARNRLAELQAALAAAERDVVAAQREYDHAQRRADTAHHQLETAETALRQADSELARLNVG
jgi:hypothetical protein